MSRMVPAILGVWLLATATAAPGGEKKAEAPAPKPKKAFIVVFDFASTPETLGKKLADSVRLRLRQHQEYFVLDRLSTGDITGPLPLATASQKVAGLARVSAGCNVSFYGEVTAAGAAVRADVRCIDRSNPKKEVVWTKTFTDSTERARGLIARGIVEAFTGKAEWIPPQYGDEIEPKRFPTRPENVNGDFEKGHKGWDAPDNVATFLVKGPKGRGKILRVKTNIARDPWIAYRRRLRFGQADPARPPEIAEDNSMGGVAGLEGVHYRSDWIRAKPGWRYWLLTDGKTLGGSKIFVKGFIEWAGRADGLPESSLAALGLTPEEFARLPAKKRKKIIAADARKNPDRHRRESYRWYLNFGGAPQWTHKAAPFPPRGGLPKNVTWFQIQVYSYWPPGEYLYDNVWMYEHPDVEAPVAEEKARTDSFEKSRRQTKAE